jgi:cytoplasmic iron level regulating protein YaaA (DUF328/UPF0246 family)
MSTLMIIQCSGLKTPGGNWLVNSNDPFEQQLTPTRDIVIHNHNIILNNSELMPAYLRYIGQLYTNMDWGLALQLIVQGKLKIIIVSALFGLLEHDTAIPNYNLKINKSRHRWLHRNLIVNTLYKYLANNPQINHVQSFLSDQYWEIVNGAPIELNEWIPYSRGAQVAIQQINPFLENL